MTEQLVAGGTDQQPAPQGEPVSRRRTWRPTTIALAGGMLTAAILGLVSYNAATDAESTLSTVSVADIGAATQTIDPAAASQLAAQAKSCKVPLARMAVAKVPGTPGGTIRIRSGNYLSPPFQLTDTPLNIAVPFPDAYPVGHGQISIEGNATGAMISLTPTWTNVTINGAAVRNVVWKPGNPCP
jgi:hypothetical protein